MKTEHQQTDPNGKQLKDSLDGDKYKRYSLEREFIRGGWAGMIGEKAHAVYSCLCCHQNPGIPFLWISQQRIAIILKIPLRTVKRGFKRLQELSIISTFQLTIKDKQQIYAWYKSQQKQPPLIKTRRKLKIYLLHSTEWVKGDRSTPLNSIKDDTLTPLNGFKGDKSAPLKFKGDRSAPSKGDRSAPLRLLDETCEQANNSESQEKTTKYRGFKGDTRDPISNKYLSKEEREKDFQAIPKVVKSLKIHNLRSNQEAERKKQQEHAQQQKRLAAEFLRQNDLIASEILEKG